MIVASYLTKHLMTHWKVGMEWFEDCLIDWDPASNAMGWQWVAGSGPDAAPYFRIFNPLTQQDKFDSDAGYTHRWVAELAADPGADARAFFEATPKAWGLSASDPYPDPIVDLKVGRDRALEAYSARAF
jgi:deoxyribodipyrimidine photo-lyase